MYQLQHDVDYQILHETNRDVRIIENDMKDLSDIMIDLSHLIHEQRESIEENVRNIEHAKMEVEETVVSLEQSVIYDRDRKEIIKNAALVFGGMSLGALGFIVGPIIGIGTFLAGAITGSSIAFFT